MKSDAGQDNVGRGEAIIQRRRAKVLRIDNGQVVFLPPEFRFEVDEVFVERQGDRVILSPRPTSWAAFFASELRPTEDFMDWRNEGHARIYD